MRPKHVRLFPAPAWCGWRSQTTPAMNLLTRVPSFRRGAAAGSAPGDADTHTEPPPSPEGEETHDNDIRFRAVDTDTGLAVDLRTGMAWPSAELRQGPRQPNGGGGGGGGGAADTDDAVAEDERRYMMKVNFTN